MDTRVKLKYLESLKLKNFTCFKEAEFKFSPGINVIIGKNGTGKTHIMKAMYAGLRPPTRDVSTILDSLMRLFQNNDLSPLFSLDSPLPRHLEVKVNYGGHEWNYYVDDIVVHFSQGGETKIVEFQPVFIPALDMMGHTQNFQSAYNSVFLDFDLTCYDVVTLFNLKSKQSENALRSETLKKLLGGEVVSDERNGRFYLESPTGKLPMTMAAEGIRKVASLVRILENNWLQPGSVLFWDEPEVNLNPALMTDVVKALFELSSQGVQVFLATHSYVILKELDLQATQEDAVAYFSLESGNEGTIVHTSDSFTSLKPNAILEHFGSLYDRDISRATRRRKPLAKMP